MDIGKAETVHGLEQRGISFSRIGIVHPVQLDARANAEADTAGANRFCQSGQRFHHETDSVFGRSAVLVGALVAVRRQELHRQIAAGAVEFDRIDLCFACVFGSGHIFGDDTGNFIGFERAGGHGGFRHAGRSGDQIGAGDGRRRDGFGIGILVRLYRSAAHMHDLDGDLAAFRMHSVGNLAPAGNLFLAVDARRAPVPLASGRGLGAFGDDQARAGALTVIFDHDIGRFVVRSGAVTRHRGHDDPVGQFDVAKGHGGEDIAHVVSSGMGGRTER